MIECYKIKDRKTGEIGVVRFNYISSQNEPLNAESQEYKELKSVDFYGDDILWHRLMELSGNDILRQRITEKEYFEFISKIKPSGVAV